MSCHPKYASHQHNQMSKKMLKSKMIHHRKKMSHHNSKLSHIYKIIQSKDINANQKLLNSMCESLYKKYYYRLFNSMSTSESERDEYDNMFLDLSFSSSSSSNGDTSTSQTLSDGELMKNPDFTFYCRVSSVSTSDYGPQYLVITNIRFEHVLTPGKKYKFDLSHLTNSGFQMSLSDKKYTFQDAENVRLIGTPGKAGACVIYQPSTTISMYNVYIYNKLDPYNSGYDEFGRMFDKLLIEVNYKIIKQPIVNYDFSHNFITDLSDISILCMIQNKGPKYFLEPRTKITYRNILKDTYFQNRQYGLETGTYTIINKDFSNPFTILNGNNPNITLHGNADKKTVSFVQGISDISDASYNFYHGTMIIDVSGNFGTCPFYSLKFGLNQMQSFFVYSENQEETQREFTTAEITHILSDISAVRNTYIGYENVRQWAIINSIEKLVIDRDFTYFDNHTNRDEENILKYTFNILFQTIMDMSVSNLRNVSPDDVIIIQKDSNFFSFDSTNTTDYISEVSGATIQDLSGLNNIGFKLESEKNYYKIRTYESQTISSGSKYLYFDISTSSTNGCHLVLNQESYTLFEIVPISYLSNDIDLSYTYLSTRELSNRLIAQERYVYDISTNQYILDTTFTPPVHYDCTFIKKFDFVRKMMDNFDLLTVDDIHSQYMDISFAK